MNAFQLDQKTHAADGLLPGEAVGQHTHAVRCRAEASKTLALGQFFNGNSWLGSRAKQNSDLS